MQRYRLEAKEKGHAEDDTFMDQYAKPDAATQKRKDEIREFNVHTAQWRQRNVRRRLDQGDSPTMPLFASFISKDVCVLHACGVDTETRAH
jgi:hypothetical protein